MAGHGIEDDPNLKGMARIFNAETNRGRANVSVFLIAPIPNIQWNPIYTIFCFVETPFLT